MVKEFGNVIQAELLCNLIVFLTCPGVEIWNFSLSRETFRAV